MVSETKEEKNNRIAIQNNRMKIERDNLEKKNKHSMEWKLFKFKSNLSYFLLFAKHHY